MLSAAIIILAITLIFLAMIIVGFIRFKKPESGWLLIAGFIGLAACIFFGASWILQTLVHELGSNPSFDRYADWYEPLAVIYILMPSLTLLILFFLGLILRGHQYSDKFTRIGCISAIIVFLFTGISTPCWMGNPIKMGESEVESDAHAVQISLEQYAVDHGFYPDRIETLIDESYLTAFPRNPFNYQTIDVPQGSTKDPHIYQPMKNIPYGSPDFEGNFTYLPLKIDENIFGFYLIGYGYKITVGRCLLNTNQDDHVIIVVFSSLERKLWPPEIPFPTVQEAILSSQE